MRSLNTTMITAVLCLATFLGGCSDSPSDPSSPAPAETLDRLEFVLPGTVVPGEAFQLGVEAVGSEGTRPFTDFSGTVPLSVSDGTVSPGSIIVAAGVGTASVVLNTTATTVELSANHPSGTSSTEVACAQAASVRVLSGTMSGMCAASAVAGIESISNQDQDQASMPAALEFSWSGSVEARAEHLNPATNELRTATGTGEARIVVTSFLSGTDRLRAMTITGSGSGTALADEGVASGGSSTMVSFEFEVDGAPVLAAFSGDATGGAYYMIIAEDNTRPVHVNGDQEAVLEPGTYTFRAVPSNETISSNGTPRSTASSLNGTLNFTQAPGSNLKRGADSYLTRW